MSYKDIPPESRPSGQPHDDELTAEQREVLEGVARKVVDWKMAVPAIMALETAKPLSFIGSQAMVFFEPIVQSLFSIKHYDTFRELMENRANVERVLLLIEKYDSDLKAREKEYKQKLKTYLRRQTRGRRVWLWLTGRYPSLDQLNKAAETHGSTRQ
jgi:hypothetical protein